MIYVLDTDHISLFQRRHSLVVQRVEATAPVSIAVTVISAEEQIRGWFDSIRQASTASKLQYSYLRLHPTLDFLCAIQILDFDSDASNVYEGLRRQKIRIGTQDLRIAAIVLSMNGILVTRNRRDFGQVPGLLLEDWSS